VTLGSSPIDVVQLSRAARDAAGNVVGGIMNILVVYADAVRMDAIFWIEKVSAEV
jgi:hypothetical protein